MMLCNGNGAKNQMGFDSDWETENKERRKK